jgi:hypothetical protein
MRAGDEFEALVRYFQESFGLSAEAARIAAAGREGLVTEDGFDSLVANFRALGLSEDAARTAAVGRDGSEVSARRHALAAARLTASGVRRMEADENERRVIRDRLNDLAEQLAQLRETLDAASDADLA